MAWEYIKTDEKGIEGNGSLGVMLVSSSDLRPWTRAGAVLTQALKRLGYSREQFYIYGSCSDSNTLFVNNATSPVAPVQVQLNQLSIDSDHRGFIHSVLLDGKSRVWLNTYDPAVLAQGQMHLLGVLMHDIRKAVNYKSCIEPQFQTLTPSPDECHLKLVCEAAQAPLIAYDIETDGTVDPDDAGEDEGKAGHIVSFQYSIDGTTGYFLPWLGDYIDIIKAIMNFPNRKVGHNSWQFDNPLLRAEGVTLNGPLDDTRWMWHHLQPELPAKLQYLGSFFDMPKPWKHLSIIDPVAYGATDAIATWKIATGLEASLTKQGLWDTYRRHLRELEIVLGRMSARGMPISAAKHAALKESIALRRTAALEELQSLVPDALKPFHPSNGYKTEANMKRAVAKGGKSILHQFDDGERWVCLDEWTPSIKNLTVYAKAQKHQIPKAYGSDKDTFAHLELERLYAKTKDAVYGKVIDYRRLSTFLDNHLENWKPAADGAVHSTFTFAPATGQLSSRRPNIQNAPKHGDALANDFRSMIEAPPGHVLLEFDFKSFHALTLGFEAGDKDYMRLAQMDIHSYLTSHLVHEPVDAHLPDDELRDRLAAIKKKHKVVRDTQAKPSILGFGFGMSYRRFYNMNREHLENQAAAKRIFDMLKDLFPKVIQYQNTIRQLAHKQGYLKSRHGYIRYFWDVIRWREGEWKAGADSESAVAFLPANDAFGHIKDAMLRLAASGWTERANLINQIHDSLIFLCPSALEQEAIAAIRTEMSKPSQVLGGLAPQVSVSRGFAWNAMEDVA